MHRPIVGDSWLKKLAREFVESCEKWWVKNLVRPVFFLLPPTVFTAVATRKGLQDQLVEIFGAAIGEYLNGSALVIIVGAFLYVALMRTLYAGIEQYSHPEKELKTADLLAILNALNVVVGDKNRRFGGYLKAQLKARQVNPGQTFLEITRPDQQIVLLIISLRTVFEYLDDKNARYRVGLLKVENRSPIEWVAFDPTSHPPRTSPQQLSAPSSTVSHAINTKSLVVVEDIQVELRRKKNKGERRYIKGSTQDSDQGSQLCFPINHASTGSVEYVITVAGDKKACLVEKHAEIYSWIIEQFSTRIALEHSLLVLKEKANVRPQAA